MTNQPETNQMFDQSTKRLNGIWKSSRKFQRVRTGTTCQHALDAYEREMDEKNKK